MSIVCEFKAAGISLHEIVGRPGHAGAALGFGLALVGERIASAPTNAAILWVREAAEVRETGDVYGSGLAGLGIPPDSLIVVEARTHLDGLRAALEGVRCAALSAVVLETRSAIDLTASRRLKLASEKSGVAVVLIRSTNEIVTNAAQVRWRVEAAPQPHPTNPASPNTRWIAAFKVEVLKHPAGLAGKTCIMEWDHERHSFAEAISVPLVALSGIGSLAA
jgi:protein ImuA